MSKYSRSIFQREHEPYGRPTRFDERPTQQMLQQRNSHYPAHGDFDDRYQRRLYSFSFIEEMEEANIVNRTVQQFSKIQMHEHLLETINEEEHQLFLQYPRHLKNGPQKFYGKRLHNEKLVRFAKQLSTPKIHDSIGILLFITGSIAIATWGRVTLKLKKDWLMATSLMFVQISPAGTQKSRIISELRKPFDKFRWQFEQGIPSESKRKNYKKARRIADKVKNKEILAYFAEEGVTADTFAAAQEELEEYSLNLKELEDEMNKVSPTLLTEKTAPLGLAKRLKQQGEAGGCIMAEGAFVDRLLLKSDSDPSFFNQCYDQEPYSADISQKKVDLRHPYFCMLSFVQQHVLENLLKKENLLIAGTMARIFPFFHVVQDYYYEEHDTDFEVDADADATTNFEGYEAYNAKITAMLDLYFTQNAVAERYEVSLTDEALNLVYDYKHELERDEHSICTAAKAAFNKLAGQSVRLAWAIHAWNNEIPHASPITAEEVADAIELCRVLERHIEYCYAPEGLRAYKNAVKIVESLQSIGTSIGNETLAQGYIDSRTLQQRTHIRAKDMQPALNLLKSHNWVRMIDNGKRSHIVIPHRYIRDYRVS